MNSDGYQPLRLPVSGHVSDMTRADARRVYDHIITSIPERLEMLGQICEQNGYSNDPDGWTRLIDDHAVSERKEDETYELTPLWRSLVLDISLAMSALLIERGDDQLRWKFYAGSKNDFDYHHPVIVGFRQAAKSYKVQLFQPLTNMALKAAAEEPMRDLGDYLEYIAADI